LRDIAPEKEKKYVLRQNLDRINRGQFLKDLELASTWQPGRSVERVATDLNKAILLAYNKHAPERRV
jgi:hypothetical protein